MTVDPLDALRARLDALAEHGDPEPILDDQALEEIRRLFSCAQTGAPEDAHLSVEAIRTVALLRWHRYCLREDEGGKEDLAAAVELFTQVHRRDPASVPEPLLSLVDSGDAQRSTSDEPEHLTWDSLAAAFLDRFEASGDPHALRRAIALLTAALEAGTDTPTQQIAVFSQLVAARLALHRHTDDPAALHELIRTSRTAVATSTDQGPERAMALSALSNGLLYLFVRTGETEALIEALDTARHAVAATPPDHPDRSTYLSNLGTVLQERFARTGEVAALDEAVHSLRSAMDATRAGQPARAWIAGTLSGTLWRRYKQTGDSGTLWEALEVGRAAVAATPHDHPDRAIYLNNLGNALRARFERTEAQADLDEAIEVGRAAVAATPHDHPDRAIYLNNLGNALRARFERTRDPRNLEDARVVLQTAMASTTGSVASRMRAAWTYGNAALIAGSADEAVAGFETAIALLPRIAPQSLTRGDREHLLGQIMGLGADAASAALEAGRPGLAVELLEQARGVLLSEMIGARGDVSALVERAPTLAAEFQQLRAAFASTEDPDPDSSQRRQRLAKEWSDLLARIRALPGFASFLLPPTIADLQVHAHAGPVIVVNVSQHRCDALIITPDPQRPVQVIRLPLLTFEVLVDQVNRFVWALNAAGGRDLGERRVAEGSLLEVLAWLWDAVVGPVLVALDITAPPAPGQAWPNVWWCPVGLMAYLPLHAAGYHRGTDIASAAPSALDRVVSSYIPTVQALAHARRRPTAPTEAKARTEADTLIVAVPEVRGAPTLPYTLAEASLLQRLIPGTKTLIGPDARHDVVLDALPNHRILHFACHAMTDWDDPAASRLLLHDKPLTVAELFKNELNHAELVVLSACSTAQTSGRMADEAVHFTGALLLAGCQHVIGTLWPVLDNVAATAAEHIYTQLISNSSHATRTELASLALHDATRQLRDRFRETPSIWSNFVHVGT